MVREKISEDISLIFESKPSISIKKSWVIRFWCLMEVYGQVESFLKSYGCFLLRLNVAEEEKATPNDPTDRKSVV